MSGIMNSPVAEDIERQIATGEILLKRAGRSKVTSFIVMALGILAIIGVSSWPTTIVVVADVLFGGIILIEIVSVYHTSQAIREIEDGMIEYRAKKAGIGAQDQS